MFNAEANGCDGIDYLTVIYGYGNMCRIISFNYM
jgi:hypothetical protein